MLQEKKIDCKSFEENLYKMLCELGRELYAQVLTDWDKELAKARDRSIYRDKGKRRTVLKTLMGEVEYSRHVYTFTGENAGTGTVYLLDEAIGKTGGGFFSEALLERIGAAVCELPYRKAAETINESTGQNISHAAVWNAAQQLGARVDEIERENAGKAHKNAGTGKIEAKVLFEEQDGIYLHLQGKDRKEYGDGREMKLMIAYDGAEKTGKDRYKLTNKVACANFESAKKFRRRKEGVIAANYNIDEIEIRALSGDGAGWIKGSAVDDTIYQLSVFHRNRAILRAAPNEDAGKDMFNALYDEDIEYLLVYIETLADDPENEEKEEELRELHRYFSNNRYGLIPYHKRGITLPEPPDGKEYRRLGAMESNIFTILGNRMKGRRKCWSVNGGNNLARLLCLKATGKLSGVVKALSKEMPEKYAAEVITTFSAAKTEVSVGKGYNGFDKAQIPASQRWLKDIACLRPFSALRV